ncbi:MAG TPA: xanthine dehydrogenase family protein subunit M [Anaerolineales bacterium]|nr:xanthine dehydrogenase family protein subunit M [Anaerolineales bacterium]
MIPPSFDYLAPKSLAEALSTLASNPEAKVLAGGQSLIPMMKFRLATPALLLDLNRLPDLRYIREENGSLVLGAMTTESELEHSELVSRKYPLLADTTRLVADPIVRNLATIGGNLAHADPANDHPAAMIAYGATLSVTGPSGERQIQAADFFIGPFESSLQPGEILTAIRIPKPGSGSGGAYLKLERKVGDFATAAVGVQITLGEDGRIASAGIGLTNVGLTPVKARDAEASLRGSAPSPEAFKQAASLAGNAANPTADPRGSAEYKRSLIRTLTYRALELAVSRANGGAS